VVQCGGQNYLARSTDEGSTWPILHGSDGAPVTVPASPVPAACGSPAPPGFGTAFAALGGGGPQLRVDTAGNLYAVEKATDDACHSTLLLRISQDGGLTWSAPLNMVAPAARQTTVGQWSVAVGYQPGQVAVSYLATRSAGGADGYITVTHDALDADPVFYAS